MNDGGASQFCQMNAHIVLLACLEEGGSLSLSVIGGSGINFGTLALIEANVAVEVGGGGGCVAHMSRV